MSTCSKQLVFIHGGETFDTYEKYLDFLRSCEHDPTEDRGKRWKAGLAEELGDDWQVMMPNMPCGWNAKYVEWKIWFEKIVPYLKDGVVLVGHSLGGIFLAKYLTEEDVDVSICATHLIAAPYNDEESDYSLADFKLPESLAKLEEQGGDIFMYHSMDDPIVPYSAMRNYADHLEHAALVSFKDRGHFLQEVFPELVTALKQCTAGN